MAIISVERGFSDQTSIFGLTIKDTIIYRLYVIQNIEVSINYRNIEFTQNELYEIYGLCLGN